MLFGQRLWPRPGVLRSLQRVWLRVGLLLAMFRHVWDFSCADLRRDVPKRTGLRSGVWWELLRVRRLRPDMLDVPGARVRGDVPQREGL